ncbi:MAG: hypothetical protein ACREA7_06375 [Nitrosotalea sp.]
MKDLGFVPTIVFEDRLLLALDKKWMELNDNKPLEFEAKINDDGKLILLGPQLIKPRGIEAKDDNI